MKKDLHIVTTPTFSGLKRKNKQKGISLIEISLGLLVMGSIIIGVLSMGESTTNSQAVNQITADLTGARVGVKSLWKGSGSSNYGTANMLSTLETSKKLPGTWQTSGAGASMIAYHQLDGTVGVTGQTFTYAITYDGIDEAVCTGVISKQGNQGWAAVYTGAASGNSAPLTSGAVTSFDPIAIATACAGSGARKMTFSSQ